MEVLLDYINKDAVQGMSFEDFKKAAKPVLIEHKIDANEAFKFLGGKEKANSSSKKN